MKKVKLLPSPSCWLLPFVTLAEDRPHAAGECDRPAITALVLLRCEDKKVLVRQEVVAL